MASPITNRTSPTLPQHRNLSATETSSSSSVSSNVLSTPQTDEIVEKIKTHIKYLQDNMHGFKSHFVSDESRTKQKKINALTILCEKIKQPSLSRTDFLKFREENKILDKGLFYSDTSQMLDAVFQLLPATQDELDSDLRSAIAEKSLVKFNAALARGAQIHHITKERTPLMWASFYGATEIAKVIIDKLSLEEIDYVNCFQENALSFAIFRNARDIALLVAQKMSYQALMSEMGFGSLKVRNWYNIFGLEGYRGGENIKITLDLAETAVIKFANLMEPESIVHTLPEAMDRINAQLSLEKRSTYEEHYYLYKEVLINKILKPMI